MQKNKIDFHKNKPKRILMILSTIGIGGGVQNTVMNIYRGIDRNKIQFDFFIYAEVSNSFEDEINKLGGRVFHPGRLKNIGIYKFYKYLYKVLKEGDYYGVHSHTGWSSGPSLIIARIANINQRIVHSHGASINNKKIRYLMPVLKALIYLNASELLSCSQQAGDFLYGKKDFKILPNSVDVNRFFQVSDLQIQQLKKDIGIKSDATVIGHIGRYSVEKNHTFIINIARKLRENDWDFQIVLVGDGELKAQIMDIIDKENLNNNFIFIESVSNIEVYYKIFDVFLLPSIHEGFGNVALEAQISKNKVLASKGVSNEVDLGVDLIKFMGIESVESWVNEIINFNRMNIKVNKIDVVRALNQKGLDLSRSVEEYYKIYNI